MIAYNHHIEHAQISLASLIEDSKELSRIRAVLDEHRREHRPPPACYRGHERREDLAPAHTRAETDLEGTAAHNCGESATHSIGGEAYGTDRMTVAGALNYFVESVLEIRRRYPL